MTGQIEDWFSSDYYSLLYQHRDCKEAKIFIDNLIELLKIPSGSSILDCGCGKGRHSIYLSEKGFEVTGIDISKKRIADAKKKVKENLSFHIHDMRNLFRENRYDTALNLFTSFGYFEKDSENNKVIKATAASLKKKGWFVLDFMNAVKEIKELIPKQKCSAKGIDFEMNRFSEKNCIIKEISISHKGKKYSFRENVKAYKLKDLEKFFTENKMKVVHLFGDYHLTPFNELTSQRLILIGRKNG